MSQNKALRIGLIGCGFMAVRFNGYKRVGDFFSALAYRPVLKAVCSKGEYSKVLAQQWAMSRTKPIGKNWCT